MYFDTYYVIQSKIPNTNLNQNTVSQFLCIAKNNECNNTVLGYYTDYIDILRYST